MNGDAAIALLRAAPLTPGRVRRVAVPPDARDLSTLPRVDYEDAFIVDSGLAQDRTAEQWSRAILQYAPAGMPRALRCGWFALGLRLGSTRDPRRVLGWELRRSTPDVALLAANSRFEFDGEVLLKRQERTLLFATFVQLKTPYARALWAAVGPGHRQVVRYLLEQRS